MTTGLIETEKTFDRARSEAFAGRMLDTVNSAGLALMTSVGHRTGLFDAMSRLAPSSSGEIAEAAGLNERYVREWLGAMVAGGVVEYDEATGSYELPAEHAAFLTRAASPDNIAVTTQWVSVLGSVEDKVVECFRKGGGVPYSAYPRFHEVMAEESAQTTLSALLDSIVPVVPGLVERLEAGVSVLEIGCGRGRALCLLAGAFPKSSFVGYDFSEEAIAFARGEAARLGLTNVRFEARDVATVAEAGRYDLVLAFDAVHDQARPRQVLRNVSDALRAGGVFLMQDIRASSHVHNNVGEPLGAFTYTISCMHCMTVSLSAGGEGLGAAWGEEQALSLLQEAGFNGVEVRRLPHDIINNYYIAVKN